MASRSDLRRRQRKRAKARQRERQAERVGFVGVKLSNNGKSATWHDERGSFGLNVPGQTQIPGGPLVTVHDQPKSKPTDFQSSSEADRGERPESSPFDGKLAAGVTPVPPATSREHSRAPAQGTTPAEPAPGASSRPRLLSLIMAAALLGAAVEREP